MVNQAALAILSQSAKTAGIPQDQLTNFLIGQYIPLRWALGFHAAARSCDIAGGPVDLGVGGARGPGKSHSTFAQVALDDCQRFPGLKCLFLRQTGKAADESAEALVDKVLKHKIPYQYNTSRGIIKFPNGSKIILGGFENENDIDKYVGIEYDIIVIEERNQLSGEKILKLQGSLRSTKKGWRARMYSSFNPGNIGHIDIKKTFVNPYKSGKETKTRFFPSTYRDNPFLQQEYIDYLEGLDGALGKAWREGNFDTFEGQYFDEWDNSQHVIRPFEEIPVNWKRYRAYDHGRTAPACCKWYLVDNDGRAIVYREFYMAGLNVDQIATQIRDMSGTEVYEYSVADPSIFAKTGMVDAYGGQTIAETFARYGIMWIPASNRRVDGWSLMHQYLAWDNLKTPPKQPKLVYYTTCVNSIRTIPNLIHDPLHPEDLETKMEDHAADVDRYFLTSLHERKSAPLKTDAEKKIDELRARREQEVGPSVLEGFYQGDYHRGS